MILFVTMVGESQWKYNVKRDARESFNLKCD